jgi:hypothetical protein
VRRHFITPRKVVPIDATFLQTAKSAGTATTYTFTSQNLGVADAKRFILVLTSGGPNNKHVSSLTVGGVAASQCVALGTLNSFLEFWVAAVPTGTTGNVVVALDGVGSDTGCEISLWRLILPTGVFTLVDSAALQTSGTFSHLTSVHEGGLVFGAAQGSTTDTFTFTGFDSTDVSDTIGSGTGNHKFEAHRHAVTSADLGSTPTFTIKNDQTHNDKFILFSMSG